MGQVLDDAAYGETVADSSRRACAIEQSEPLWSLTFPPLRRSVWLSVRPVLERSAHEMLVTEVMRGMTLVFQNLFSEKVTIKYVPNTTQ